MSASPIAQTASASRNHQAAARKAQNVRLFSERQIAVASYLATPVAGTTLFAWNAALLGRTGVAAGAAASGLAVTALLVLAAYLMPIHMGSLVALAVAMGLRKLTMNSFENELKQRRESGKGWQSNWTATGVSLACLLAVIGAILLTL